MSGEVHQCAMRNVVLQIKGPRYSVPDLIEQSRAYEISARTATVEQIFAAISEREQDMLDAEVIIHNGVSASSRNFWVFLFLCAVARQRGTSPLDVAGDIVKAGTAKDILLA